MKLTEKELVALVSKGAGASLDLWPTLPDDDQIARSLCAFANTRGGWIVVGATERGAWPGSLQQDEDASRLRLVAEEDLKPALRLSLHQVSSARCASGGLLAVQVLTSDDRPHSIPVGKSKREIIVRAGQTNQVAEGATLNAMRSHRTQGKPKGPLEAKIMSWMHKRAQRAGTSASEVSPEDFSQSAKVGLRRASKAFISLEREGLLIGSGGRSDRLYALP